MLTMTMGLVGVSIFVLGASATVIVNVIYFVRVRRAFPDVYKTPSIAWKDAGAIKKKIDLSGDKELARLYTLSTQVPIISFLLFGSFIILFILLNR